MANGYIWWWMISEFDTMGSDKQRWMDGYSVLIGCMYSALCCVEQWRYREEGCGRRLTIGFIICCCFR